MAAITVQEINGPYEPSSDTTPLSTLTWTAATTTGDTITMPGRKLLVLLLNSGASTRTYSFLSSADAYGRKADIAATNIGAGAIVARFFEPVGWEQTLGGRDIALTCNHAEVLIAAIAV